MATATEHAAAYPEHHKLGQIKDKSQTIGEFLDRGPYRICELVCMRCGEVQHLGRVGESCCNAPRPEYVPLRQSIGRLLAEYFGIDLAKLDPEKREMLAEIRRQNDTREAEAQ